MCVIHVNSTLRVVIVVRCLMLPASSLSTAFTTTPDYPLTMSESESEDSLNSDMDIFENESSSNDVGTSESEDAGSDSAPEGMYGNEPEYTAAELLLLSESSSASDAEESGSDLDSSRLENMHWCTCSECSIMPTLLESKCCQEFKILLGDKLTDEVKCIIKDPHFDDICLKRNILEASYIQHRRYRNNFKEIENINNT